LALAADNTSAATAMAILKHLTGLFSASRNEFAE
jgi:hypothetical protein